MGLVIGVQILEEATCISLCANALRKGIITPSVLPFQLWVNNRAEWVLKSWLDSLGEEKKPISQTSFTLLKN